MFDKELSYAIKGETLSVLLHNVICEADDPSSIGMPELHLLRMTITLGRKWLIIVR